MQAGSGWYSDPWGLSDLRWWDGVQWTGHVAPVPERPGGLVVVDVETTGLGKFARIVEVGCVLLGFDLCETDRWETLINPDVDVGPVEIHGVTASMVAAAPRFGEVAPDLLHCLDGRVVVGHNVSFDLRMLRQDFDRCGGSVDFGDPIDTMELWPGKLSDACAELGITDGCHRAIDDALATAELLQRYRGSFSPGRAAVVNQCDTEVAGRRWTREAAAQAPPAAPCADIVISPGLTVCLTGRAVDQYGIVIERSSVRAKAAELGLVEAKNVSGKVQLVVAGDPQTLSGKGKKARELGIPIVTVTDFLTADPTVPVRCW